MPAAPRQPTAPGAKQPPSGATEEFRRVVLLLETAAVLESRARRVADPTQASVLRRRAEQRVREAEAIRSRLGLDGPMARPLPPAPVDRRAPLAPTSSPGRRGRT